MRPCIVCCAGFLCAGMLAVRGDVTLVAGGRSDYVIVTPAAATPSQRYAAEELQRFTAEMTGVRLPIQDDAGPLPAKAILLGHTRHSAALLGGAVDLAPLGDDGFRLTTAGGHLVILGSGVRGTLYGVYEVLERWGGCRWYSTWQSVIPRHETWVLPELDDTQTPAFVMREPFWYDLFDGDLAARCRANGNRMDLQERHGGKIRFGGGLFVHTFYRLISPEEFFGEHPEYFSEIDGRRVHERAQLCLSNPDVVRLCTERVLERIRKDPGARLYSLSQNDWAGYCTCAACRAIDEREGSPAGSLIHFVNQVAEAVEKEFPDVWIETLAYQYTRTPPKTIRPRHNVVPRLCTIECDFSLPLDVSPYPQNRKFVEDIRGWSAMTDKLYVWDYTTNFAHYIGPHPNFASLQGNARFFRDNHVVGLFEQGAYQGYHAEFAELRGWVLAKLLWNPDQDVEALYRDFFAGYYGAAAPLVRAYFDDLQRLTAPPEVALTIWMPPTSAFYPAGFFEAALETWRQAEAAVQGDPVRLSNVRMGALPVLYALLCRAPTEAAPLRYADGRYTPAAADDGIAALAREFLTRFGEGRRIRIAESAEREAAFLSLWRGRVEGFATTPLRGGGWTAAVCPDLGGRVSELAGEGLANVVDPRLGIDVIPAGGDLWNASTQAFRMQDLEPGVAVQVSAGRDDSLVRSIRLDPAGLHLDATHKAPGGTAPTPPAVLRLGLALGDARALCLRVGQGPWETVMPAADEAMVLRSFAQPATVPGTLTLASPFTGRAIEVDLGKAVLETVMVLCDIRQERLLVLAVPARAVPPSREPVRAGYVVRPLAGVTGLPVLTPPASHTADRVVIEDCLVTLGRYGVWGEHVADPLAEDGRAAKLIGNHYEWCLQWRIDPQWFEPGTPYALRVRLRVEPSGQPGKAFWAGIYDTLRRRGFGQIDRTVDQVGEGYQWYEVGTWVPEAGQYLWVGPGQFDAAKGPATSAVKAVYVDRFELRRSP